MSFQNGMLSSSLDGCDQRSSVEDSQRNGAAHGKDRGKRLHPALTLHEGIGAEHGVSAIGDRRHHKRAILDFQRRERRFGGLSETSAEPASGSEPDIEEIVVSSQ